MAEFLFGHLFLVIMKEHMNFKDFFEFNLKKNNILTLNALSKKLGHKTPSLLSMIATGKRLPSTAVIESLFDEWNIEHKQREIIRIKVEIEKHTRLNRPAIKYIEKLRKIDERSKYRTIDMRSFDSIKNWYNIVLQMLITTSGFVEDYTKISYQLKRKVTPLEIRKGIETLIRSKIVKRNHKTGELSLSAPDFCNETIHDSSSDTIRHHHKSMIVRAMEAIDEDDIHDRHVNSLTLKFNKDKNNEAKNCILSFVKDFNEKFHDSASSDIHQLNVQFFEHTYYQNKTDMNKREAHKRGGAMLVGNG